MYVYLDTKLKLKARHPALTHFTLSLDYRVIYVDDDLCSLMQPLCVHCVSYPFRASGLIEMLTLTAVQ